MRRSTLIRFSAALVAAIVGLGNMTHTAIADPVMDPKIKSKAKRAADQGLRYLRANQAEDGSWAKSVGITALALRAFLESHRGYSEQDGAFITRPIQFLLKNVKPDGSVSESIQNRNYNTATAITALAATRNPKYKDVIAKAQKFITGLQHTAKNGYDSGHAYHGGMGYGGDERPDLSNMLYALESLKATGVAPEDPAWKRALLFVSRSQNRSESNDQKWAGNDGGFTYMPGYSPHGGTGSYGSMTHAGLISLLFAGVDKKDPRIQAAYGWIRKNYTVDDNPGSKSKQGLYYYYTAFAKSMYAMGEPVIVDSKGVKHNWRNDLAGKLIGQQQEDGSWVNKQTRWWEGVKSLVTARSVIALNLAIR
jgi:squalene-hopene/tetraprenyl-beta-curcumene cyclase